MTSHASDRASGRRARWHAFLRPSTRTGVAAIFIAGLIGGILSVGGYSGVMEYTSTMDFCISCHEMRDTVYQEYKTTVHYANRSGVRVTCPDCHVPKPFFAKLVRKIGAVNDLYQAVLGTVDTPEKFEAKRLILAERVWTGMVQSDSRECRTCHSFEAMASHKQTARAQEKMQEAMKNGQTCIECHKGIAHKRPTVPRDD